MAKGKIKEPVGRPLKTTPNKSVTKGRRKVSEKPMALKIVMKDRHWRIVRRVPLHQVPNVRDPNTKSPLQKALAIDVTPEILERTMTVADSNRVMALEIEFEDTILDLSQSHHITMQQAQMVRAYLTTAKFNMRKAMRSVGYSESYTRQHHMDMVQSPKIVAAMQSELFKSNTMPGASRHWLQEELRDLLLMAKEDKNYNAALKAVEMLGRSIGELGTQVEHTGTVRTESISYIIVAGKKVPI